jgi:hypothetical protein
MNSAILAGLLSAISLVWSAQTPCDLELLRQINSKDNDRYYQRDKDRCEGVYLQQVAATFGEMLVASLTASGRTPTQWPANAPLTLRWSQFADGDVHIQAFALVPRKHFRLDVIRGAVAFYDWSTSLVAKYLIPSETGLIAWTVAQVNNRNQRVYLPVAIGSEQPKGCSNWDST